jgi:hypothetical protein
MQIRLAFGMNTSMKEEEMGSTAVLIAQLHYS